MLAVPRNRPGDPSFERYRRLVPEQRRGLLNRRHAQIDFWTRMRPEDDLRLRLRQPDDHVRELEVRRRPLRVAKIERLADGLWLFGAPQHAVHEVVDVAPRADLRAVVVERDRQMANRLEDDPANRAVTHLP